MIKITIEISEFDKENLELNELDTFGTIKNILS